jgi:anti-anti-sigma regulatory factor
LSSSRQLRVPGGLRLPAPGGGVVVEDVGGSTVSQWICGRPADGVPGRPPRPVVATVVVGDEAIVVVVGSVDRFSWVHLELAVLGAVAAGGRLVVLDGRQLAFVDATVVSRLASIGRRLREEGGALRVASPPPVLRRLVDLLLLGDALGVDPPR